MRSASSHGDRPRPGAAADVEQTPPTREVERLRERRGGAGENRLDSRGGHLLQLIIEREDLGRRSFRKRAGQLAPGGVADLVPGLQERTEVAWAAAGEKRLRRRTVPVGVTLSLEQSQRHHGVRADARGAARQTRAGSQPVQRGRRTRVQGMFDIYNILNANSVLGVNGRFGSAWLQPTAILAGRPFKFGTQIDF